MHSTDRDRLAARRADLGAVAPEVLPLLAALGSVARATEGYLTRAGV